MRHIIISSLCALLVACGGGGGSSSDDPHPTPVAKQKITIYVEGDSTMFGAAPGVNQAAHNQPTQIQTLLGDTATVQNHAVPGTTFADSINGTNGYDQPLAQRLATSNAHIVVANFAINDSQKFTTSEYGENLAKWLGIVRAAGKIPVLIEPNPTNFAIAPWTYNLSQYVTVMQYEANIWKSDIVSQFSYLQTVSNWQAMLSSDGIHPLDSMYAIMGERDAAYLKPMAQ
jgi:lysophospholipase L1-like esterase